MPRPSGTPVETRATEAEFMANHQRMEAMQSPTENLFNTVSPEAAFDFVEGCAAAEVIIARERPDIVVIPERGAGPIAWTIQNLALERREHQPHYAFISLGTNTNADRKDRGLTGQEKITLVNDEFDHLQEQGVYDPQSSKVLLIDEVQKGGTISQVTTAVHDRLKADGSESTLSVIAMDDIRTKRSIQEKNHGYRQMIANEKTGIRAAVIPVNLFTVDRPKYLNTLFMPPADTRSPRLIRVIQNAPSQELFRNLAHATQDAAGCMASLERIEQGMIPDDSDVFGIWLVDALTLPRDANFDNRQKHYLGWVRNYLQFCKSVNPPAEEQYPNILIEA